MTETIGNVILNYDNYQGSDLYCDGSVEDELLKVVDTYSASEFPRIIEERKNWPFLYHLSTLRENIVEWIPMDKSDKVLEVGSGCGAITGVLSRKAGSVTCVDLSKKRSMISAYRHRDLNNITIHIGNFKDIELNLDQDYDYILLIGVFEYGNWFIGGSTPYHDWLNTLKKHLSPKGRIIIAIENKYGMKYFAGCKEDHLGTYFSGIENYSESGGAQTFGRNRLESILNDCGMSEYHFYYPYPDYKFMTALYSDGHLPGKGELSNNLRNFDQDRMVLFDERKAFDGVIEEGLFPVFSNSYLVVIGKEFPVKFVKYSNDRAKEFAIRTVIMEDMDKKNSYVCKYPLSPEAEEHVRGMGESYEKLQNRYRGGMLSVNQCTLLEEGQLAARFEYVKGISLSEMMDKCLVIDDTEGFYQLFREYVARIGYGEEYPAADYDMVFTNILVSGDCWTLIDYEWTFYRPISTKEIAFRAITCYLLEDESAEGKVSIRKKISLETIYEILSMTKEEGEKFRNLEIDFQKYVTGSRRSMAEMRDLIGHRLISPGQMMHLRQGQESLEGIADRMNGGKDTSVAAGKSLRSIVKRILIERQDVQYRNRLNEKHMTYDKWMLYYYVATVRKRQMNIDKAVGKITDDIYIFHSDKGRLSVLAESEILWFFQEHSHVSFLYGDEDIWGEKPHSPWFKPDWSPETLGSFFYFGSVFAARGKLIEQCGRHGGEAGNHVDGRTAYQTVNSEDNVRIYYVHYPDRNKVMELARELVWQADGFTKGCRSIGHVPMTLFHSMGEKEQKAYLNWNYEASRRLFFKDDLASEVTAGLSRRISVIIPSKDNPALLNTGLKALLQYGGEQILEIIIVDNGSDEQNKEQVEQLIKELADDIINTNQIIIKYQYTPMDFHFSRMCNLGASQATGGLLLFLNDDVELSYGSRLDKMAEYALCSHIGAVGSKLYYPNTVKIQHAGIVNLPMGPVHKLQFLEDNRSYYFGRNTLDYNVLAVTGACLMVEKRKFEEVGGFSEELAVAFNDVELCFALYRKGYHNVVVNTAYAYHHESLSRGDDESPEKWLRLNYERNKLYEKHKDLDGQDPYYSIGLNRDALDTAIRPAYITDKNTVQFEKWKKQSSIQGYRQDPCLMVRIEYCGSDQIQGYGVVLGDDNACYERSLWLQLCVKGRPVVFYAIRKLHEQYRPDLEENMPDQRNVALCGFAVEWVERSLPQGSYRVGLAVRNRVTGLRLCNWSNQVLLVGAFEGEG